MTQNVKAAAAASPAGRLKAEAIGLVGALGDRALASVTGRVQDAAGRLTDYVEEGAGPGLMEAASRGATLAGGPSIGYTTYYDRAAKPDSVRPYGGGPALAFWKYAGNSLLTDGLIFTSISTRETAMIRHSAAILIAPGGTGTEWETFQILETIKSKQLAAVPIYLVGDRGRYWKSLEARIEDLVSHGAVAPNEATAPVEFVDNAEDVIQRLRIRLKLPSS